MRETPTSLLGPHAECALIDAIRLARAGVLAARAVDDIDEADKDALVGVFNAIGDNLTQIELALDADRKQMRQLRREGRS